MKPRLLYLLALTLAFAALLTAPDRFSAQSADAAAQGAGTSAQGTAATAQGGGILDDAQLAKASGGSLYRHICQACHMPDAEGAAGAGHVPALARDPRLASAEYMAAIVLNGRADMPPFRPRPDYTGFEEIERMALSDAEIAAVINFVRSHFGNHYRDRITAAEVKAVRVRTAPPRR